VWFGSRGLQGKFAAKWLKEPQHWPRVAVVVPATGSDPGMRDCLTSLLDQNYPDFEIVIATQSRQDPATSLAEKIIQDRPYAQLVVGAPAQSCSQKNHNLLTGLDHLNGRPEIFVFADATRSARPNWLTELVRPIALGHTTVSTGYHHVIPGDVKLATLGRVVTVLGLHLLQGFQPLTQTWGGNTAILRETFNALNVRDLWSRSVVDDVSLASLLRKNKIRVTYVPHADLTTAISGLSMVDWDGWLARQWIYLKFYFPIIYLAGGIFSYLGSLTVLVSLFSLASALFGFNPPLSPWFAGGILAYLFLIVMLIRRVHPHPGPLPHFIGATAMAVLMASWCHIKTVLSNKVFWRGICYTVDRRGSIMRIRREVSNTTLPISGSGETAGELGQVSRNNP
jgi:ceramide glucosyltransferase